MSWWIMLILGLLLASVLIGLSLRVNELRARVEWLEFMLSEIDLEAQRAGRNGGPPLGPRTRRL